MTDLDVYQAASAPGQYQAGIIMDEKQAKALDDQVRACTKAVLREGTDYGHIPGTSGDEKSLWRPGAQKLLQWFRLECTCDRIEVERDDDGRKHGITYRAEVGRGLKTATPVILATCEGTADYDESKFWQSAEEVQRKAEYNERKWAKQYGRVADPTKWKDRGEYRADWNALMKRAQKRAIVGAVVDATAAGGIFTDREEDDTPEPVTDDGPSWYEEALEAALSFTDLDTGRILHTAAAQAHRDGRCTRRQQDHIQNRITQRARLLKNTVPVDVEDLGQPAAQRKPANVAEVVEQAMKGVTIVAASDEGTKEEAPAEDQPGTASADQLTALHITFGALGFGTQDRDQKLKLAETIAGRQLTGPHFPGRTSKNLSFTEARKLTHTLEGFGGDRDKLIAHMATLEQDGDGDG